MYLSVRQFFFRRHFQIGIVVADGLDEQTFLRLAGDDGRACVAAREHGRAGIQHEPALDFVSLVAVAFEAAIREDGPDLFSKENHALTLADGCGEKRNGDEKT